MAKNGRFLDKYWFAVGYHNAMNNTEDIPTEMMTQYIMEEFDVDIVKSYSDGVKAAKKDGALIND